MKILAIESSCDETSAALVESQNKTITVHSNITATSLPTHAKTGGIIPENAAREQVKFIIPVVKEALGKTPFQDVDAIAVTYGPGLIGSLLVGVETAKALAFAFQKPLIPVNHLLAHIFANFITNQSEISFPFVGLIVSGGHTDLVYFESVEKYKWLGGTLDDAAGECFDKCARLLGYDYPGGPKISQLAKKGNAKNAPLPKVMLSDNFDFSFSGLKAAFMRVVQKEFETSDKPNEKGYSWIHTNIEKLPKEKQQLLYDLCASLEQTIVEVLVRKTLKAAEEYNSNLILLGGGVSANETLLHSFNSRIQKENLSIKVLTPLKEYCTDNAAMIGSYALFNPKDISWKNVFANPELYFA